MNGHRQNAVNGNNRAVQPEFTEGNITGKLFLGNDTHAGQQAQGDRQVEMGTLFKQIGRGKINGDAFGRKAESQCLQSSADAFAAFGHCFVGQADNGKCRQAYLNLKINVQNFQTVKGDRVYS